MQRFDSGEPERWRWIQRNREFFARHRVLGWLLPFAVTFLLLFGGASALGRDDALRFAIQLAVSGTVGLWFSSWFLGADEDTRRGGPAA